MWVDGVVVTHQLKEYIEGPWFKPKSIHCFYLKSQIVKFGKSQLKLEFVPPFFCKFCSMIILAKASVTKLLISSLQT